jgi:glyoxylase-like metal-dependent hydrolase (beta-lactamase superfamily II)
VPRPRPPLDVTPILHPTGARSYVVVDPESREAMVVDPLLDRTAETLRILSAAGATLRWIVDTHSHADHLSGAPALHERTGADVVMSAASDWRKVTRRVGEGDVLALGEQEVRVRAAPGVTPDAIVLEGTRLLFTGDTLLVGTMGLKDAPGADPLAHYETVQRVVDPLADDVVVHPGHDDMGRSQTTIKAEKRGNRWVREKDRDAYVARWEADPRRAPKEAEEILRANREGETTPPPEALEAAGKAAAAAAAKGGVPEAPPAPSGALLPEGTAQLWVVASVVTLAFAVLGALVHPLLALGAALVAVVQLAAALPSLRPRRKKTLAGGLYYHGPEKKGPMR